MKWVFSWFCLLQPRRRVPRVVFVTGGPVDPSVSVRVVPQLFEVASLWCRGFLGPQGF